MKTTLFDFHLPDGLIAERPVIPRDSSRMLVVKNNALEDSDIKRLPYYLKPGDILVFNDTKVIPARLWGIRGLAKIEILLHKRLNAKELLPPFTGGLRGEDCDTLQTYFPSPPLTGRGDNDCITWQAFAKPAKKLRMDDIIIFAPDFSATVTQKLKSGEVVLAFAMDDTAFFTALKKHGAIPLPPYIEKKRKSDASDVENYQTIFADAQKEASVAAPTAGLHFTPELLAQLAALGVKSAHITLHVGGGTFLPVKVDDTTKHIMHSEWAEISMQTAKAINAAKASGGRVIAVGTTSLRTLESAVDANGVIQPFSAETAIFITPGYTFKAADVLLTNFHLPKSTLFMLVSAFCGLNVMQNAYTHAIVNQYRFYSYGDACLLYKD